MPKPVNETSFWKERILEAASIKVPRHSVYQTSDEDWNFINRAHTDIIKKHVTGMVLDAGCGYGRLAEMFTPESYFGIDFSPDFIQIAKETYPDHRFVIGHLENMPMFTDGQFDWAICISIKNMMIGNINEQFWLEMLTEIKRVAKNVLILEYSNPLEYEIL